MEQRPILIYTYWFSYCTYGAYLLKKDHKHIQVISRAHRVDIYKEFHPHSYLPLRKLCAEWADIVYPCSHDGTSYIKDTPRFKGTKTAYLGIPITDKFAPLPKQNNPLCFVSCSGTRNVKRIKLLINSIKALALSDEVTIIWHHLGGGKELESLKRYARIQLQKVANLEYIFHGKISRKATFEFYKNEAVHAFINVSSSEGIPVSIMEASALGIPIIATNVGGTSEIVSSCVGILLPADFSDEDFIKAAYKILEFNSIEKRDRIKKVCLEKFDKNKNFKSFTQRELVSHLKISTNILKQKVKGFLE